MKGSIGGFIGARRGRAVGRCGRGIYARGFEFLCGDAAADFAFESNLVGADLSGVLNADVVVVEVERLNELDGVAGDFSFLQVRFALLAVDLGRSFSGKLIAI